MKFIKLDLDNINELFNLEEKMYWQSKKWNKIWQRKAKEKFRNFIKDYLVNFSQGCFGLIHHTRNILWL